MLKIVSCESVRTELARERIESLSARKPKVVHGSKGLLGWMGAVYMPRAPQGSVFGGRAFSFFPFAIAAALCLQEWNTRCVSRNIPKRAAGRRGNLSETRRYALATCKKTFSIQTSVLQFVSAAEAWTGECQGRYMPHPHTRETFTIHSFALIDITAIVLHELHFVYSQPRSRTAVHRPLLSTAINDSNNVRILRGLR